MNYRKAELWSRYYREDNDCSVKAVAIACDVPYKLAKDTLESVGARRPRSGANLYGILAAIAKLGFVTNEIEGQRPLKFGGTISTLTDKLPKRGMYIALVRNHILTVKNGKIEDWTEGRRHQVQLVYKVERCERKPRHKKNAA